MKKSLIDLHTHSVLSRHAYSSLTENIDVAVNDDMLFYGISEHQYDEKGVGAHIYAFGNCRRITPKKINNTNLLVGIELNILDEGIKTYGIPVDRLNYAIASIHGYVYDAKTHDSEANTRNYLKAMEYPYVKILGHIDNPAHPCDYETIVKETKKRGILIELNNASLNEAGPRKGAREIDKIILDLCVKYDQPIILSSDAHIKYQINKFEFAEDLLKEVNFPDELVVNYNMDLIEKYIVPLIK